LPQDLIPRYTILATLAESEKASVYLARSAERGHEVALKVSAALNSVSDRPQFAREYAALAAISHPAIVDIYDYGIHGGREYLAMEYFPHGDLKQRMQKPLAPAEALRYLELIAGALHVVHTAGIVHRDLKPLNVMLRENDTIVLIDFGLARDLENDTRSTRTGVVRGSPYYMSPEQALGEELDERSDLYSLGVIFFEMLTGMKPFTGSWPMEVLEQHVSAPRPGLPVRLAQYEHLVAGLLARSRPDRYDSAYELLEALGQMRRAPGKAAAG
jgi:eukaryotic-like serine/threonine-protein kinase